MTERRHTPTEVRADDSRITGYASVFYREGDASTEYELWKGAVERIDRHAFDRALEESHDVRALYNHEPDNLLGRTSAGTLNLSVDSRGLRYDIQYDPADDDHKRVQAKIKRGDLTGSSFAFKVTAEKWSEEEDREVRTVTDVQLIDVGPVVFPAYQGSSTSMRHAEDARSSHDKWKMKRETQKRLKKLEELSI
ncbi:HK97 family phage prohead protease [Gimesia maris]|uniref:HK97 family phage prohead protease n=1 Tax=Gimesia maris TaxID=122 RepID=UPI0030D91126|tara:strand:- start:125728 stop:126309 length:582 start_codon:yes stop_codon:yes gene_type:complete